MKKLLINAFLGAACLLSCEDTRGMNQGLSNEQKKANEIVDNIHNLGLNESGEDLDRYFKSDNKELTVKLANLIYKNGSLHSHFCRALEINDWPLAEIIFLNDNIDVNQPNAQGIYPLMFALRNGNLSQVMSLVELDANLYDNDERFLTDHLGNNLWYYAIQGGPRVTEWLYSVSTGLNPDAILFRRRGPGRTVINFTPLMLAFQTGNLETVQFLIQEGAKLFDEKGHLMADSKGNNLLYYALSGELKTLEFLLEQPNVKLDSFRSEQNNPVFIEACRVGSAEVVEWLINKLKIDVNRIYKLKIDVNHIHEVIFPHGESSFATTALMEAVNHQNAGAVKVLLDRRADVNLKVGMWSPLRSAVSTGNIEIIKMLLQDPKIDKDEIIRSSSVALYRDSTNILKLLLSQDIDINMFRDSIGQTLLYNAVGGHNSTANVQILLEDPGIDVNVKNPPYRCTALHLAAVLNDTEVVSLLLNHPKILVNETDKDGRTPLFYACQNMIQNENRRQANINIVQQLLERNDIDVNKADNDGATPLLKAYQMRKDDIVSLLLEHGAKAEYDNILYIIKKFPKNRILKALEFIMKHVKPDQIPARDEVEPILKQKGLSDNQKQQVLNILYPNE